MLGVDHRLGFGFDVGQVVQNGANGIDGDDSGRCSPGQAQIARQPKRFRIAGGGAIVRCAQRRSKVLTSAPHINTH